MTNFGEEEGFSLPSHESMQQIGLRSPFYYNEFRLSSYEHLIMWGKGVVLNEMGMMA